MGRGTGVKGAAGACDGEMLGFLQLGLDVGGIKTGGWRGG